MSKELLINQTFSECRVAFVENREIIDLLIERVEVQKGQYPDTGDIYLGKVVRILPGMQAAFIDIGTGKTAYLYVDDAYIPGPSQKKIGDMEHYSSLSVACNDLISDEWERLPEKIERRTREDGVSIETLLKIGEEIVVQVTKPAIGTKGPRVTRLLTLAGRYLVFMPYVGHIGVSRRIEDEAEKERLKEILMRVCSEESEGVIARTAAIKQNYKILKKDFATLQKTWGGIQKILHGTKGTKLIYKDLNFIQRILRDHTDESISKVLIDSKDLFKEVEKYINRSLPSIKGKIHHYTDEVPLFEQYGIEQEIEKGLSNTVPLPSGGSINIDQTEALVSIDVNTGKYVGRKSLEDTVLQTNLEAVKEIAYQLRLRNCAGIIIIDFIDMAEEENRQQIYLSFIEILKKDHAKTNVLPISELGLIEMTRKRTRDTLSRVTCIPCAYCEGTGRIKSATTVCYELIRTLIKVIKQSSVEKINIFAHPNVTNKLCGDDHDLMSTLEEKYDKSFVIRSENSYHLEQYEIFT